MISIIVPIYKVENYLEACVDSILKSTYRDFEVILVDDGSPDRCGEMCDNFAASDPRVRVIHKPNEGISEARNDGLKAARGEYIAFVDGDDVIHPRMLEVLHDAINSGDYDFSMVLGVWVQDKGIGYDYVGEDGTIEVNSTRIISQQELMGQLANVGYGAGQYHVVWNKLYKKSIVDGHWFRKVASEDMEWLTRITLGINQGILVESGLYYYIQRSGSIMNSNDDRKIVAIDTQVMNLSNIPTDKPEYRAMMLKALYSRIFSCRHEFRHTDQLERINAKAVRIYNQTKHELLHSKLSLLRKLRILLFFHNPSLFSAIVKLRYSLLKG